MKNWKSRADRNITKGRESMDNKEKTEAKRTRNKYQQKLEEYGEKKEQEEQIAQRNYL